MPAPANPKIYHIVHVDRIGPIVRDGGLLSCAAVRERGEEGTSIGMRNIKERRLGLTLESVPGLLVGSCVPFYFCSRSVMLYMIRMGSEQLEWRGGQGHIVHLEADLRQTVDWADANALRWGFTLSNAASGYFEDRCDLSQLAELNWEAINATIWPNCRAEKQAEFLIEGRFPWSLVERVGVQNEAVGRAVISAFGTASHRPPVSVQPRWYYS